MQNNCLEGGRGLITPEDHTDGLPWTFEANLIKEIFFSSYNGRTFKNYMRLLQEKKM